MLIDVICPSCFELTFVSDLDCDAEGCDEACRDCGVRLVIIEDSAEYAAIEARMEAAREKP